MLEPCATSLATQDQRARQDQYRDVRCVLGVCLFVCLCVCVCVGGVLTTSRVHDAMVQGSGVRADLQATRDLSQTTTE